MSAPLLAVRREDLVRFLGRKRAGFRLVLLLSLVSCVALSWWDYRLMVFVIIALTLPFFLWLQVRAFERELGPVEFAELRLAEDGVEVTSSDGEEAVPTAQIVSVRLAHDYLVVVQRTRDPHQPRHFTFPGARDELEAAAEALRGCGLAVLEEPGVEGTLVKTFSRPAVMRSLVTTSAGLTAGAIIEAVRWLTSTGSPWLALGLLGGALVAITLASLVRLTLPPSEQGPTAS